MHNIRRWLIHTQVFEDLRSTTRTSRQLHTISFTMQPEWRVSCLIAQTHR